VQGWPLQIQSSSRRKFYVQVLASCILVFLLSIESNCVIATRVIKLARGGTAALDEAWHILTEKTAATAEIPHVLYSRSPLMRAAVYRKSVRSNLRRLSASRKELEHKSG
jgi:hypothetical protein